MKKKLAAWIALGILTLAAGLLLSMTNEITKDVIKEGAEAAEVQARKDVLPSADSFEPLALENMGPLTDLFVGVKDGQPQGYVGTVSAKGYGGPVQVIAGLDAKGLVTGVSVGGSTFKETAGLGAKAKEAAFTEQFIGKQTPLRAVKNVNDRGANTIDAITAATITTNAVTGGVNNIANVVDAYLNPDDGAMAEGTTYTASAKGFAGPVAVFVTAKDDGTITALKVGDELFAETEGFGAAALESSVTKQFVGKSIPLDISEVDALSGATYTKEAIVNAINQAFDSKSIVVAEGTLYSASEKGFASQVAVFVRATDEGEITELSIGDEQFNETEGYGLGALEPAFMEQFVGKQIPLALTDIDTIAGATLTSRAVVDAINRAFGEKLIVQEAAAVVVETASPAPVSEDEPVAAFSNALKVRGALGVGQGYGGDLHVAVVLTPDNVIGAVKVLSSNETPGIGSKALELAFINQFVGKSLPLVTGEADVQSGATLTSNALMDAINNAFFTLADLEVPGASGEVEPESPESPASSVTPMLQSRSALGTGQGYGGDVTLVVLMTSDLKVAGITALDNNETQGIGSRALEAEYLEQFIGQQLPLNAGGVDALSGATVTSQAVVEAMNQAAAQLGQ